MRRLLFGVVCFTAGLFSLPLLILGARVVLARQTPVELSEEVEGVEVLDHSQQQTHLREAAGSEESFVRVPTKAPEHGITPLPECALDQIAEGPTASVFADEDPFSQTPSLRGTPQPGGVPVSVQPQSVLPADPGMLVLQEPIDQDEIAKLAALRETLQQTIEAKAALLNAGALQAEIALHQRHLADLRALLELERLQTSLQELSDKYPDSDAGRRAHQALQLLKMRRPVPVLSPTPDHGSFRFKPGIDPNPVPQPINPNVPTY